MMRSLKLEAPSLDSSNCSAELVDMVTDLGCAREWLDMIEREFGHIFAIARRIAAERKADAEAEKEAV